MNALIFTLEESLVGTGAFIREENFIKFELCKVTIVSDGLDKTQTNIRFISRKKTG